MHATIFHHNSVLPCSSVGVAVTLSPRPTSCQEPAVAFAAFSAKTQSNSSGCSLCCLSSGFRFRLRVVPAFFPAFRCQPASSSQLPAMHIAWLKYLNNSCVAMHKSDLAGERTQLLASPPPIPSSQIAAVVNVGKLSISFREREREREARVHWRKIYIFIPKKKSLENISLMSFFKGRKGMK